MTIPTLYVYCDDPRHLTGRREWVARLRRESTWVGDNRRIWVTALERELDGDEWVNVTARGPLDPAVFAAKVGGTRAFTEPHQGWTVREVVKFECPRCEKRPGAADRPVVYLRWDRFDDVLDAIAAGQTRTTLSLGEFCHRVANRCSIRRVGNDGE